MEIFNGRLHFQFTFLNHVVFAIVEFVQPLFRIKQYIINNLTIGNCIILLTIDREQKHSNICINKYTFRRVAMAVCMSNSDKVFCIYTFCIWTYLVKFQANPTQYMSSH